MAKSMPTAAEGERLVAAALAAMRGRKAVVVGDLILDVYLYGETQRISREAPVLVVRQERQLPRLGAAGNTAANLAALGLDVGLIGVLGDDPAAATMRSLLNDVGCSSHHIQTVALPTVRKTRILAGAFGTARQQVLRLDHEPDEPIPSEALSQVAHHVREAGRVADVVVVSDYGLGTVRGPVMEALTDLRRAGVPVCVDSRHRLREFVGMTALTPNSPEAEGAVRAVLSTPAAIEQAGRSLLTELDCEACLITQGRHGMTLFEQGRVTDHMGVVGPAEVTDVTGAGDSVIATFAAALAAGLGMRNGMRLATCAAGVVVNRQGCAQASPQDVMVAARHGAVGLEPWQSANPSGSLS